jgi:hypothetical protein
MDHGVPRRGQRLSGHVDQLPCQRGGFRVRVNDENISSHEMISVVVGSFVRFIGVADRHQFLARACALVTRTSSRNFRACEGALGSMMPTSISTWASARDL